MAGTPEINNQMRKFTFFYGMLSFLIFCSCGKQTLSPSEYVKYIEDESHGLKVSRTIGDVQYAVLYKPSDYMRIRETHSGANIKEEKGDLEYFSLHYSLSDTSGDLLKKDITTPEEYYERVNYMSYGMQNDIRLVEGTDTLSCRLYNFVRSYGLSPAADIVLAFESSASHSGKTLLIDDNVFGAGMIKIKFEQEDIENIPVLRSN
jgi:hypothetical protein